MLSCSGSKQQKLDHFTEFSVEFVTYVGEVNSNKFVNFQYIGMPEVSRFYGIIIKMYYNEHNPPQFHIEYQIYEAVMNIETGEVIGKMSRRALNLVYDLLDQIKKLCLKTGNE